MERQLNVAMAAKLVGIGRREIQKQIQVGNLQVFEGDVTIDSLLSYYPDVELSNQKEISRVERIQHNAVHKLQNDLPQTEAVLTDQVNRLRLKLQDAEVKNQEYEHLLLETRNRLTEMQKHCDRQQKQTLTAFLGWMMTQYNRTHG